jgi:hypothetical protein
MVTFLADGSVIDADDAWRIRCRQRQAVNEATSA